MTSGQLYCQSLARQQPVASQPAGTGPPLKEAGRPDGHPAQSWPVNQASDRVMRRPKRVQRFHNVFRTFSQCLFCPIPNLVTFSLVRANVFLTFSEGFSPGFCLISAWQWPADRHPAGRSEPGLTQPAPNLARPPAGRPAGLPASQLANQPACRPTGQPACQLINVFRTFF